MLQQLLTEPTIPFSKDGEQNKYCQQGWKGVGHCRGYSKTTTELAYGGVPDVFV